MVDWSFSVLKYNFLKFLLGYSFLAVSVENWVWITASTILSLPLPPTLSYLSFPEEIKKEIELNYAVMGRVRATLSVAEEIKTLKAILTSHPQFLSCLLWVSLAGQGHTPSGSSEIKRLSPAPPGKQGGPGPYQNENFVCGKLDIQQCASVAIPTHSDWLVPRLFQFVKTLGRLPLSAGMYIGNIMRHTLTYWIKMDFCYFQF